MDDSSRNSLALLGRGGAHCIYRYRGADPRLANCVLRVPRAASSGSTGAEFVERTLRPLLGAQYLPPPVATLRLDAAVARALCTDAPDAASLARAAAALEAAAAGSAVGGGGAAAQAELDHTRPELAAGAPTLCVELKPKSGALPGGPPLADARRAAAATASRSAPRRRRAARCTAARRRGTARSRSLARASRRRWRRRSRRCSTRRTTICASSCAASSSSAARAARAGGFARRAAALVWRRR